MNLPMLVTGGHRTGTTWVGRMLCAGGEAFYIHEPFNVEIAGPIWMAKRFPYQFYYTPAYGDSEYEKCLQKVIDLRYPLFTNALEIRSLRHCWLWPRDWLHSKWARLLSKRPLIKDPIALFSAEWLAHQFNMKVIMMIRHPAAFASSLKRLNWEFDFSHWQKQKVLMSDVLHRFKKQIDEYVHNRKDIIDQAILLWNVIYSKVNQYRQDHPDWMFVKHEDLAANAPEGFKKLYEYCGLTWSSKVRSTIAAYSNAGNPQEVPASDFGVIKRDSQATIRTWEQRLSTAEIQRIHSGTEEIASLFYHQEEWN